MPKKNELYCPRCKSKRIYDYGRRFVCMECMNEYFKKDFYSIPDEEMLTIKEKVGIAKVFRDIHEEAEED